MSTKLTPAREVAYDAFIEVMERQKSPGDATEFVVNKLGLELSRVDRKLVKEILFGGLRWYSKILWIVQNSSSRKMEQASEQIRAALILGTYQIFYMDRIPDRAAVNESVEYVRKKGQANAVKFVNGILRSIARRSEYFTKPDKDKRPVDYLALQFAYPKWIVERWSQRFSFERLKGILAENNKIPPFSIRMNKLKISAAQVQQFRANLLKGEKTHSDRRSLRSCLHLSASPSFAADSLFGQGYFTVQDEASQLIGLLVAPAPGETVVDACCGPGGKASHIYELGEEKIHLVNLERNEQQLDKAKDNFRRLGFTHQVEFRLQDFLEFKPEQSVDRVLVDAPCSGLGVLRRHPEGKWHKKVSLIGNMVKKQREMLVHGLSILRPGGELVFSVCSFEPEETLEQLDWLQKDFGDKIEVVSPASRLPDYYKRFVSRELALLVYSGNKEAMDGFGAFIIRKACGKPPHFS